MDIAEMKVSGRAKGKASVNVAEVQGGALAHTMVAYAWKEAEAQEKRSNKLAMFVQDICKLSPEAHGVFRAQLTAELKSIEALEEVSGMQESRKAGYSLNSFKVMVSNWRTISEAAQIGFKGVDSNNKPMPWTMALETARDYRKTHAAATGTTVRTAAGKTSGAGRKAMSPYDKVLKAAAALDKKDQRRLFEALGAMFKATISYPAKPAAKSAANTLAAPATVH